MSDVKISATKDGGYTFGLASGDLETDPGLESAVLVSLFSDKRVPEADAVDGKRQGWWADVFLENDDQIGSKLWTLARSKVTPEVLVRFETFAKEALEWMIVDGVASDVRVDVEAQGNSVYFEVTIERPSGDSKFNFLWNQIGVESV